MVPIDFSTYPEIIQLDAAPATVTLQAQSTVSIKWIVDDTKTFRHSSIVLFKAIQKLCIFIQYIKS